MQHACCTRGDSTCLLAVAVVIFVVFFFNDTATTEIYTLSLHDALPICFEEHGRCLFLSIGLIQFAAVSYL